MMGFKAAKARDSGPGRKFRFGGLRAFLAASPPLAAPVPHRSYATGWDTTGLTAAVSRFRYGCQDFLR